MPLLGEKVQCYKCSKDETFMWHSSSKGVQCNDCHEIEHSVKVVVEEEPKPAPPPPVEKPKAPTTKKGNKTARIYKTRQTQNAPQKAIQKPFSTKGKGRRIIFKKKEPVKLTTSTATYTTSDYVHYKGSRWRSGDIVSVRDVDGGIYYAQLNQFLTDMYCEKSVSITWLLPTRNDSPYKPEGFDPMTFVIGPDDDLPRKLEYFEFVMHCPSDYFRRKTPFPDGMPDPRLAGYIWTRLGKREEDLVHS